MVTCQLLFHGLMCFPALARAGGLWLARPGQPDRVAPLTRQLIQIDCVMLPVLFFSLIAILAYDLNRPRTGRDLPATTLLVVQAAYVAVLFR